MLPGTPLFVGRDVNVFSGQTLLSSPDVTFHWRAFTGEIRCEGPCTPATAPLRACFVEGLLHRCRVPLLVVVADPLEVFFLQPYITQMERRGGLCGPEEFCVTLAVDEPPFAQYFDRRQLLPHDHPDFQALFTPAPAATPRHRAKRARTMRNAPGGGVHDA